jgi:ABC-type Zn uptake system ZnuABC Zn-binding protein ZnuA
MKTPAAFVVMLAIAAVGALAVVRLTRAPGTEVTPRATSVASTFVLAGHPATLALAHALAERTALQVSAAWPVGLPWAEQVEFVRGATVEWQAAARRASAVVTLRHAARGDALFAAVRALNPRVVEIDASVATDQQTPSVRLRAGGAGGPGFALSPTNAIRLAERIAADLSALQPGDATVIAENLRATKERLLRLKAKYETEFARVAAPEVVGFSDEFDDLGEDFGLQIVGRFEKDFAVWTPDERRTAVERLQRTGARVSVHAFPPGRELAELLARAKVVPVVLDPLSRAVAEPDVYWRNLEANLSALKAALGP